MTDDEKEEQAAYGKGAFRFDKEANRAPIEQSSQLLCLSESNHSHRPEFQLFDRRATEASFATVLETLSGVHSAGHPRS